MLKRIFMFLLYSFKINMTFKIIVKENYVGSKFNVAVNRRDGALYSWHCRRRDQTISSQNFSKMIRSVVSPIHVHLLLQHALVLGLALFYGLHLPVWIIVSFITACVRWRFWIRLRFSTVFIINEESYYHYFFSSYVSVYRMKKNASCGQQIYSLNYN